MSRLLLKVDVDTLVGFTAGTPALLALFREVGVTASFFIAMGPDNSGKAIRRVFTRKGFLGKMLRTGAPRMYGLKTMLYGTLLPPPRIAARAPQVLRQIIQDGHEAGLHAYDHVHWHDNLHRLTPAAVHAQVLLAQREYVAIMGEPTKSFAAPGWQCTAASRAALAAEGFLYASDTRGQAPYWPRFGAQVFPTLEIPTTCPTLDEYVGRQGRTAADFFTHIRQALNASPVQVLTVHAELEGRCHLQDFRRFLHAALQDGIRVQPLAAYAREVLAQPKTIPVAPVSDGFLPGRAGSVACQGPPEAAPCE